MQNASNNKKISEIEESYRRIQYYKKIVMSSVCPGNRLYFENAMLAEVDNISRLARQLYMETKNNTSDEYRQTKEFTAAELANYDGTGGKPAYVAVNGIVYDVSNESTWGGSTHFGLAAGKDVSAQFNNCHNMQSVLAKLPKVGIIKG